MSPQNPFFRRAAAFAPVLFLFTALTAFAAVTDPYMHPESERFWTPAADTPFLQEWVERVPTASPVTAVAVAGGLCHAVVDGKVHLLQGTTLSPVPGAPEGVERLLSLDGALWAMGSAGLHRMNGGAWAKVDDRHIVDLCAHNGAVLAATRDEVFRLENGTLVSIEPEGGYLSTNTTFHMEDGTQILPRPVKFGPLTRIASYGGTVYALQPGGLALFDGEAITTDVADWGLLPSPRVSDLVALGSRLFIGTDRGLGVLRGMSLTEIRGAGGLPSENITCLARGFDRDLWIGSAHGAARMTKDGDFHWFGAGNWLPGARVNAIAAGDRAVHIATDGGLAVIHYTPWTLAAKADYYERFQKERGMQRLGFIHSLYWGGDDLGWIREISDNDGGHTAHYLAAMAFKYAATGDEAARAEAVETFKAMIWLEEITGVRGLIARAVWVPGVDQGQKARHGSGGLPARWYPTPDGKFEWKGDTSSDEVSAHYYAVSVFHDYAAKGPEKARAAEHLRRMTDHIIENGWKLRDANGETTRWGRWDPEYLQRPYGMYARGLNGMEAQAYAVTAHGLTGDAKYEAALRQLMDWGYHRHTVRQKLAFPPEDVIPWDDRLAFDCYFPMLRYVTDPALRLIYLRSIERSWAVKRMERVPWFNYVYSVITGNDCDTEDAAAHLREWPVDLRSHSYTNSVRDDLAPDPDYPNYGGGTRAMGPRDTGPKRGSRSALPHDGGAGGRVITEPAGWLEDYWMGRYFGFILPPNPEDAALPGPPDPELGGTGGAKPYSGPQRPDGLIPGE